MEQVAGCDDLTVAVAAHDADVRRWAGEVIALLYIARVRRCPAVPAEEWVAWTSDLCRSRTGTSPSGCALAFGKSAGAKSFD
jgi:hypothetical protein